MSKEIKIRFLRDVQYNGGGVPQDARNFKKGEVYSLNEASAAHWVTRRRAEYVDLEVPVASQLAPGGVVLDAAPVVAEPAPVAAETPNDDSDGTLEGKALSHPPKDKTVKAATTRKK